MFQVVRYIETQLRLVAFAIKLLSNTTQGYIDLQLRHHAA